MNLTPLDIRKKEFKKVMRGLDPAEVESFLEDVSDFVVELLEENKALHLKVTSLDDETKILKEITENPPEEDHSEKDFAEREAKMIIREAEIKAFEILERAKADQNRIKEEVIILKTQKATFLKRLKQIISSQVEMLDVLELDDLSDNDIATNRKVVEETPIIKEVREEVEFKINPQEILEKVQQKSEDELNIDLNVVKNDKLKPKDNLPFIRKKKVKKEITDQPYVQESLFPMDEQKDETEVIIQQNSQSIEEKKQDLHKNILNNKINDDFERILDELGD